MADRKASVFLNGEEEELEAALEALDGRPASLLTPERRQVIEAMARQIVEDGWKHRDD